MVKKRNDNDIKSQQVKQKSKCSDWYTDCFLSVYTIQVNIVQAVKIILLKWYSAITQWADTITKKWAAQRGEQTLRESSSFSTKVQSSIPYTAPAGSNLIRAYNVFQR